MRREEINPTNVLYALGSQTGMFGPIGYFAGKYAATKEVGKVLKNIGSDKVSKLLEEALFDPALAKTLLMPVSEGSARRLHLHLLNIGGEE